MDPQILSVGISDGQFEEVLATAYSPIVTLSELIKNSSDACYIKKDTIVIDVDESARTIVVRDNGVGLSANDINRLKSVGTSMKMRQGNVLSRIGEPYAGSKGLGLLTAFNLCKELEVVTHSEEDDKNYLLRWEKGTKRILFEEYDESCTGTTLIMKDIDSGSMKLITDPDEVSKLFLSSITYYTSSETLPLIDIYINGIKRDYRQTSTLEALYQKYNRPKTKSESEGYFVAKATFKYKDNKLTLSYDDNLYNVCSFKDEEIDLTNIDSARAFLSRYSVHFKNFDSRLGDYDIETKLDEFEGVYYIWRERKKEDLTYPWGVRVYVNNYGLYNYLGKSNDWTQHTEISQSVRSTNYKYRNTYGYVLFNRFNEDNSCLKISKERNDFIGNLARKKFYHIMREYVSGIFSSIDIALKNNKGAGLALVPLQSNRKTNINKPIDIRDLVRSGLTSQQLLFDHGDGIWIDREKGLIHANSIGNHKLKISNGRKTLDFCIEAENPTPKLVLKAKKTRVREGETYDLRQAIVKKSTTNVDLDKLVIKSDEAQIEGYNLKATNKPDTYPIYYIYKSEGHPEISQIHDVIVYPLYEDDFKKLKKLFPDYEVIDEYHKLNDVVEQISKGYINSPVICGIALRSLVEITIRHFLEDVLEVQAERDIDTAAQMNRIFNALRDNDSRLDAALVQEYRGKLLRTRKQLFDYYKKLGLNHYVHDTESIITSNEILAFSQRLRNFLGFVFKSLVVKNRSAKA